jgi:hypothetical protein
MPSLQKNAINPHFGNKYISLDVLMGQVLPVLNEHGFILIQSPTTMADGPALRTTLLHADSGDAVSDVMPLLLEKLNPQGLGSAITYARRYALMSLLGLVADEDDDAERASGAPRRRSNRAANTERVDAPVTDGEDW